MTHTQPVRAPWPASGKTWGLFLGPQAEAHGGAGFSIMPKKAFQKSLSPWFIHSVGAELPGDHSHHWTERPRIGERDGR